MRSAFNIQDFVRCGTVMSTQDNKILAGWGSRSKVSGPSGDLAAVFYFSDFFLTEEKPWSVHEHCCELTPEEFINLLMPYRQEAPSRSWQNLYKTLFLNTFHDIQRRIKLQELQKAVPFVFETSRSCMNYPQLIASLLSSLKYIQKFPGRLYGFWDEHQGILGVTPEVLFSIHKDDGRWKLETIALAGTKDSRAQGMELKNDLKTLQEHSIVVEGIRESLNAFGKVKTGALQELKLPTLTHLKTPMQVMLDEAPDLHEVISRLHPTPALGAYPRLPGIAWLKQYQTLIDRKRYGAPAGYVRKDGRDASFYVAIRNMQWTPVEVAIGAGCGIVAGSQPEKEWEEILLKIKAVKEVLSL